MKVKIRIGCLLAIVAALALLVDAAAWAGPKDSRVNPGLTALYAEHAAHAARRSSRPFTSSNAAMNLAGDWVVIDAVADIDVQALEAQLASLGAVNVTSFGRVVSALLPISAVPGLEAIPDLRFVQPAHRTLRVDSVRTQGDQAQRSDLLRSSFSLIGVGVTVGVLSDSYNCLGGAASDSQSSDLPLGVQVLQETPSCTMAGTDEGRAMLQIVHDIAPGASLAFATAEGGQATFANNIVALFNSGAKVITDDVGYFLEPFFQDGIIAQAVDFVVAGGAAYFSAAGNDARKSYESVFRAGPTFTDGQFSSISGAPRFLGGVAHNFAPTGAADPMQRITIPSGAELIVSLQWDSPSASVCVGCPGSPNDVDVYLLNGGSQVVAGSTFGNINKDASELLTFTNAGATADFNLMIVSASGPLPGFIKYVQFGSSSITIAEFDTASGTIVGHPNAAGAEAVGAAFYGSTPAFGVNPPLKEAFSSAGSTPILFDTAGRRLATPIVRAKPEIVAPDGGNTTFFGVDIGADADTFPNFFGTSAAAPHAAGVAALLMSSRQSLPPFAVYSALEGTTVDMGPAGFDFDSGFGLIRADVAALCASAHAVGQTRDFDGNCRNDILWRHSSGTLVTWFLNGLGLAGLSSPGSAGTDWTVVGAGDFNGDGNGDILWRHSSGVVYIWLLNGSTVIGAGSPGSVPNEWAIVGIGDFNGDGKADILWRHSSGALVIWFMNGTSILSVASLGNAPTGWAVAGVGDFNRDGRADILWRHSSGGVVIWLLNGANVISVGSPGAAGTDWTIVGVGDFNGDGRSDILWRHASGSVVIWLINGTTVTGVGSPGSAGLDWTVQKTFDFNGDGRADILWRHSSGLVAIWLINGTSTTAVGSLGGADSTWTIQ